MARTIRIDDEVYAWLQRNARPFEDSPNSALRRLAGLDAEGVSGVSPVKTHEAEHPDREVISSSRRKAKLLNEKWEVGALHALFHKDGCWYNNLERFPGAYFDPSGYVLFETREAYRSNTLLKIGERTNIPGGIYEMPGYVEKQS